MLRRLFIEMGESLLNCSHDILESCKAGLLTALQEETSDFVRRELCDDVGKLARICSGDMWWSCFCNYKTCWCKTYILLHITMYLFLFMVS